MTKEELKNDICRMLQVDVGEVADTDNLIDHGLDSIRLMALIQAWTSRGSAVRFEDLAAYPEINHWWTLFSTRPRE